MTRLAPVMDERAYGMESGAVSCATSAMSTLLFALKASSSPPRYLMMETISIVWMSSSVGCIFAHFVGERLRRAAGEKVLSCEGCAQARETCQLGVGVEADCASGSVSVSVSGSGLCEWQAMPCECEVCASGRRCRECVVCAVSMQVSATRVSVGWRRAGGGDAVDPCREAAPAWRPRWCLLWRSWRR